MAQAAGPAPGLVYGGFWIRLVAYIIDAIILGIVAQILAAVVGAGLLLPLVYILEAAYFIGMWGYMGQTIGMIPFKLKIVRAADGGKITWMTAVMRLIGFIIAEIPLLIGLIWAAFDPRKQGWHDKIAGTVVVKPA